MRESFSIKLFWLINRKGHKRVRPLLLHSPVRCRILERSVVVIDDTKRVTSRYVVPPSGSTHHHLLAPTRQ